jgi:hypothetical protein
MKQYQWQLSASIFKGRLHILDEISMVSCSDCQLLAMQAAEARNVHDKAFGGLSVIVAGDFAQLPPMTGPSL